MGSVAIFCAYPVLTFDRLMGGIDLNKYLTDIPEYTTGRLRYNPVNMLKTVLGPMSRFSTS